MRVKPAICRLESLADLLWMPFLELAIVNMPRDASLASALELEQQPQSKLLHTVASSTTSIFLSNTHLFVNAGTWRFGGPCKASTGTQKLFTEIINHLLQDHAGQRSVLDYDIINGSRDTKPRRNHVISACFFSRTSGQVASLSVCYTEVDSQSHWVLDVI